MDRKEELTKMMITALELGDDELADILIKRGADGDLAFIWYAKHYNIDGINRLKDKVNVNRLDSRGFAAADYACVGGSGDFCRELFSIKGIRVNTLSLIIACKNNNIEAFREVLKFPINVNLVPQSIILTNGGGTSFANSALILAVKSHNLEMVQAIRPYANEQHVNYAPCNTNTFGMIMNRDDAALHIASYNGDLEIVKELKKFKGFDINIQGGSYKNALESAIKGMSDSIRSCYEPLKNEIEELRREGWSVIYKQRENNASDEDLRKTADNYNAKMHNMYEKFKLELKKIIKKYFTLMKELLKDKNININATNEYNETALYVFDSFIQNIKTIHKDLYHIFSNNSDDKQINFWDNLLIKFYEMLQTVDAIDSSNKKNIPILKHIEELYTKIDDNQVKNS